MRRLSRGRTVRGPARLARLREERGGIAVMLALLMPILFGAAAIGIDTAAVWSARQQVQTGADAAVIAVAMDCARNDCGNIKKTAEDAFWANNKAAKAANLGAGIGLISTRSKSDGTGTVSQTITTPWVVNHFFAAALGEDTGELSVSANAEWAPLTKARSELPIAISYCTYRSSALPLAAEKEVTLGVGQSSGGSCTAPGGDNLTGGVAFTQADGGSCGTTTQWTNSYELERKVTQGPLPSACTDNYMTSMVGRTVTLPVWDRLQGKTYRVHGYAAFHVTGWEGSGARKLTGYFTRSARQVDDTTPPPRNAPDLGARAVFLTED